MITPLRVCLQVAIAIAVVATGCSSSPESPPNGQEAQSLIGPDGDTRAFVWIPTLSGGLGATVSQPYQAWLESKRFASKTLVVEAYKTDGLHIAWAAGNILEVCYADARIYKFLNGVDFAAEESPEIVSVEIVLRRVKNLHAC